ncbi:hypothetical protein [Halobacteriovorax sp. HLS]|uniref:hypothetical protein n=1 Tax=Halobacteriovorax sp. HLS TaxID=2234000 RepID=UPI000FDBEF3A|nr:hypothetical protein [Halobacteriovorax sp. HLS]
MTKRSKLNVLLFVLLFISIGYNFFNAMKSLETETFEKLDNVEALFNGNKITGIQFLGNLLVVKVNKNLHTYQITKEQAAEVNLEAKKRGLSTYISSNKRPPTWISALINWGPLTIIYLIMLLSINLSNRFKL